jgi:hypothetical protein
MTSNPKAVQKGQRSFSKFLSFWAEKSYAEVNAAKSLPKTRAATARPSTAAQVLGG